VGAFRAVRVVELGEGTLDVVVVVLDAGVAGGLGGAWHEEVGAEGVRVGRLVDTAVGIQRTALEQGADPERLVQLLAVGGVAGVDRQVHGAVGAAAVGDRTRRCELIDLADHRLAGLWLERLPGAPGGAEREVQRSRERIDHLDPGRRLLIGQLEVGELAEVDERGAFLGPACTSRRQLLAHRVGLAGAELEEAEAAARHGHDSLAEAALADRVGDRAGGARRSGRNHEQYREGDAPPANRSHNLHLPLLYSKGL
jgi:hypothetical protein